jgi:hypothetical protein
MQQCHARFIDNEDYGTNDTVYNNTLTTIYGNHSITECSRSWKVNCTRFPNTGESDSWILNIDRMPPIAGFGTNSPDSYISSSQTLTFELFCSDNKNVTNAWLQLWGNWTGVWTANQTNTTFYNATIWSVQVSNIPEGYHLWGIWCNDTASNSDLSDTNRTFTVDITPPVVSYVSPTDPDYANVTRGWTYINVTVVNSTTSISTCILEWAGVNESMTMVGSGSSIFCYKNKTASDGTYSYRVYSNDSANNFGATPSRTITIDTAAPSITIYSPVGTYPTRYPYITLRLNISVSEQADCSYTLQGYTYVLFNDTTSGWVDISFSSWVSYTITVECWDWLDNYASSSTSFSIPCELPDHVTQEFIITMPSDAIYTWEIKDEANNYLRLYLRKPGWNYTLTLKPDKCLGERTYTLTINPMRYVTTAEVEETTPEEGKALIEEIGEVEIVEEEPKEAMVTISSISTQYFSWSL